MLFHSRPSKAAKTKRSPLGTRKHWARLADVGVRCCFSPMSAAAVLLLLVLSGQASADTFGSGDNSFDIDFVTIGDPGNAADTKGRPRFAGAVDYAYRIGTYEISRDMVDKANAEVDLKISMHRMTDITGGPRPDMPAAGVSWNEAARYVNWLNMDAGSTPAYKFETQPGEEGYRPSQSILLWDEDDSGYDADNRFRNSQAKYFLPSVDEWYKAAFYDPNANEGTGGYWNYPTGSDTAPMRVKSGTDPDTAVYNLGQSQGPADITQAGGLSPYGVMGLGGNLYELMETNSNRNTTSASSTRVSRGNNWFSFGASELTSSFPGHEGNANFTGGNGIIGFRVAGLPEDGAVVLQAGDSDQDLDFDQLDLIRVQVAAKYLTGQVATWGEGDWNGAPGGSVGDPPVGDGLFNQFDIVAAQQAATYLAGPYAAIQRDGQNGDGQTSVVYSPDTGELAIDAPSGAQLTSINIDSAAGIFTGESAQSLGGSFDNDSDGNIFKATFGSSFGSISLGSVAQAGLSEEVVLGDLSVVGSLAGGGDLGDVDLIYVPEPSTLWLVLMAVVSLTAFRRRC